MVLREDSYEEQRGRDVVDLIGQVLQNFSQAKQMELAWSRNLNGHEGSVQAMEHQLEAVREGELRMAVVAPMKAGKSTLVNSIVGYEFLPARAAAMTTLPTRIVLERQATDTELSNREPFSPRLTITPADEAQFRKLISSLRKELRERGPEIIEKRPYLADLVQRITSGQDVGLKRTCTGREAVQITLLLLNDLVRLAALVFGNSGTFQLSDVPVIRTSYWSPDLEASEGPGRLVVIDTPGPDEEDLSAMLGAVVRTQLTESHIVLVVLDYTKMGGHSDAQIRTLMQPTLDIIGTEKLYAVVNKIDQRKHDTDLDPDGIRSSAAANLGLTDQAAHERVFTASAEWALRAVRVLADLRGGQVPAPAESDNAVQLLKVASPLYWQDELEDLDLHRLEKMARRAWKLSEMNTLLGSAIAGLRARALPLALEAALLKAAGEVADLLAAIAARRDLIGRKSDTLTQAAAQIADEMTVIGTFRDSVAPPDAIVKRLRAQVDSLLDTATDSGRTITQRLRDGIRREAASDGGLTGMVRKIFRVRGDDTLEFDSEDAANYFIHAHTVQPRRELEDALATARSRIESTLRDSTLQYVKAERAKVQPIVQRAADRLKAEFDIDFAVPDLSLPTGSVSATTALESETRTTQRQEEREVHRRSYRTMWLWKTTFTETVSVDVTDTTYLVRADALAKALRDSYTAQVNGIRTSLGSHVSQVLVDQINEYYDNVEAFLQRYRDILDQSSQDNALQEQEQSDLRRELEVFHAAVDGLRRDIESQLRAA
ncbi:MULTISPECIES: dynamin family protein [Streptacidiphilus]|uniref:Dynamin family protein n=1 Tax=Streptacidiphilus cavernicola TaxID=3342716 RepID=A0ABV6UUM4_9ACTN|nr:dynamin family protein [Streptacidiphilus jeojiense]